MPSCRRVLAATAIGLGVSAAPLTAEAAPRGRYGPEPALPFEKGTILPEFGFGFGWSDDLFVLSPRLGARYFVIDGLSFGGYLEDDIFLYSDDFKAAFPGLTDQVTTNVFKIVPLAQYVFYRSRWFSPYVVAGLGPAFFNNGGGIWGQWVASPGFFIGTGSPVFIDLGVLFSGMFPTDRCNEAFEYNGSQIFEDPYCNFTWGPKLGIVVALGTKRAPERRSEPPPPNPMYEPVTEDESFGDPFESQSEPGFAEPEASEPAPAPESQPVAPSEPVEAAPAEPAPAEPAPPGQLSEPDEGMPDEASRDVLEPGAANEAPKSSPDIAPAETPESS